MFVAFVVYAVLCCVVLVVCVVLCCAVLCEKHPGCEAPHAARQPEVWGCAHLSTTLVLESARADPVAKQLWRAFHERSLQGSHRLTQQGSTCEGLGLQAKPESAKFIFHFWLSDTKS